MIERWQSGFDVVLAIRSSRAEDHPIKRMTANGFYRLFGRLSDVEMKPNAGDFRLMDQRVVQALRQLPERTRFMKGLFAWLGFKQTEIYFSREKGQLGTLSGVAGSCGTLPSTVFFHSPPRRFEFGRIWVPRYPSFLVFI